MRKVTVVFLVLTILTVFAACTKQEKPDETSSLATTTTLAQPTETTAEQTTEDAEAAMTYILTTVADKTVPWEKTTRFETLPVSTSAPTTDETTSDPLSNVELTTGVIEVPEVSSDVVTTEKHTNEPPTAPEDFTNNATTSDKETTKKGSSEKDTTKKDDKTTTEKQTTTTEPTEPTTIKKTAKGLSIESSGYNSNTECIILDVSADGWSSEFKRASKKVTVVVDGQPLQATCKVPSTKNADGRYELTIDLSELGISSGSTVSYTIDEGVIQTKAGTQYNSSYTGTCDVG